MFTGIIRELGTITSREATAGGLHLTIQSALAHDIHEGDSVAVNGACLTALTVSVDSWTVRLMKETISRTSLGQLIAGDRVNLERPVRAGEAFDGHFVLGHVDGICTVIEKEERAGDIVFTFAPPADLLPYLIPKGSVALDGVSLTIVDVTNDSFTVSIMPYTLAHTTFGQVNVKDVVNIEVDMLAKQVARLLAAYPASHAALP